MIVTSDGFDEASRINELRGDLYYPKEDGVLFEEAVRCLDGGAYRMAVVGAWLAAAEGIKFRFERAAERDAEMASLVKEIKAKEARDESIDTFLVDKAVKHGVIAGHDHRRLTALRQDRNQYGHPSGASPTHVHALACIDAAVDLVLSRPALLTKSFVDDLVKRASEDMTFFTHNPSGLRRYVGEHLHRLTSELKVHLIERAIKTATVAAYAPERHNSLPKITALASAVLLSDVNGLLAETKMSDLLAQRTIGAALVCLEAKLFTALPTDISDQALASILEPPADAADSWKPPLIGLAAVSGALGADSFVKPAFQRAANRYYAFLDKYTWRDVSSYDALMVDSLCLWFSDHVATHQNDAAQKLFAKGSAWCAELGEEAQARLGAALRTALHDDASKALWLRGKIQAAQAAWPSPFRLATGV